MNKKVLRTMITLVVVFLVALYVLKIFFPEQFVMAIQNEQFIKIGAIVDSKLWLALLVSGITTFSTMFLYLCAITRKWCLSLKETLILLITVVISRLLYLYDVQLAVGLITISMFILPWLYNGDLKVLAPVYSIHYVAQLLSLKIRNLPLLLTNVNSVVALAMSFETYIWLLLFYLYYNYKKEIK